MFNWFLTTTLYSDRIPTKLLSHDFLSKLASSYFDLLFSSVKLKKGTSNNFKSFIMKWGRGTHYRHDHSVWEKLWQFKVTTLLVLNEIR